MGKAIFQTDIIELGEQVDAFFEEGMFVLFGENVPDTLKDFCHFIDQKNVDGTIKKGDKLVIDQKEYLITAVGDIAQSNLETLGHLTVVFSGAKEAGLPGSICVEAKPMPKLSVGKQTFHRRRLEEISKVFDIVIIKGVIAAAIIPFSIHILF